MKILDKELIFSYVDAWMIDPIPEGEETEDEKEKSEDRESEKKVVSNKDKTMKSFGMDSGKIL